VLSELISEHSQVLLKPALLFLGRNPQFKLVRSFAIALILTIAKSDRLLSDTIYFTNGSVLVVEKAREEKDRVEYQTSEGVKTIPRSSVQRIYYETSTARTALPSRKYGIAVEDQTSSKPDVIRPAMTVPSDMGTKEVSEEIIKRLAQNLNDDPGDLRSKKELINALNSYASLQSIRGDLQGAQNTLERALSYDKTNLTTLINFATLQYQTGNYRAAEDLLLHSIKIDSKIQYAHYLLGEAYYAQDKISQAIDEWKVALQVGPDSNIQSRLKKAEKEAGTHNELGSLQSAHFILRYDRQVSDYRLGQEILFALERAYRQLSSDLISIPPATVTVIVYPDQTYFDITQAPRWTGALFDGKIRVPVKGLSSITADLSAVLTHELTHSFISFQARAHCPAWFNEGVAQLQEGKSASRYAKLLADLKSRNQLIPLTRLEGSFIGSPSEVAGMAYIQSLSAIEYLVLKSGRQAIRDILDLLHQNYNFETALKLKTSQTLASFENSWHTSLAQ
jgi:tetratricopeptide (TPR) repeat protein